MFLKVTQSGGRRYAQLVESFRNEEGKPRQRTLGRPEPGGEVDTLIAGLQRVRGEFADDLYRLSQAQQADPQWCGETPGIYPVHRIKGWGFDVTNSGVKDNLANFLHRARSILKNNMVF